MKPRVLLLNGTCLEIIGNHRQWLQSVDDLEIVEGHTFAALSPAQRLGIVSQYDGLIGPSHPPISTDLLRESPSLRVVSLASSGFDTIDLAAATEHGVAVTNATPREGAEVVAEYTWGLLLAVARQILIHDRQVRRGDCRRGMGTSLVGRTLGIVGLGRIGRAVALRASGFGMNVLACGPRIDASFVAANNIRPVRLRELLELSDVVSLHVRLNASTTTIIGKAEIDAMKPTAILVNAARRKLLDESALVDALCERRLAGAALDDPPSNPNSPLLQMHNVVITPHIGNRADVGADAVFRSAVKNAADVLAGRPCHSVLNPDAFARWRCPPSRIL